MKDKWRKKMGRKKMVVADEKFQLIKMWQGRVKSREMKTVGVWRIRGIGAERLRGKGKIHQWKKEEIIMENGKINIEQGEVSDKRKKEPHEIYFWRRYCDRNCDIPRRACVLKLIHHSIYKKYETHY